MAMTVRNTCARIVASSRRLADFCTPVDDQERSRQDVLYRRPESGQHGKSALALVDRKCAHLRHQAVLLVTFFRAALARRECEILLWAFGGSLGVVVTLISLEAARWEHNGLFLSVTPMLFGLLSQAFGAGVIFPLWFGIHRLIHVPPKDQPSALASSTEAVDTAAVVPGILIGFLFPSAVLAALPYLGSYFSVSQDQLDTINALWQVYPFWLSLATFGARMVAKAVEPKQASKATRQAITTALLISAASSTFLYYGALYFRITEAHKAGKDPVQALIGLVRVPLKAKNFGDVAHLFLAFDFVVTLGSALLFVASAGQGNFLGKLFALLIISAVASPGTAVAWGYWRSDAENRARVKKQIREKKQ